MIYSDSEFLQYAFRHYDNPHLVSVEEFNSDLKRIHYVNNLIRRYVESKDDLKGKLLINHMVIIGNCFSVQGAIELLTYKIEKQYMCILYTCFRYLEWVNINEYGMDFWLLDKLENDDSE